MFMGTTFVLFTVFHSIVNLFPQIMALSISYVSLQACYRKSFSVNDHLHSKCKSFLPQTFYHVHTGGALPYAILFSIPACSYTVA